MKHFEEKREKVDTVANSVYNYVAVDTQIELIEKQIEEVKEQITELSKTKTKKHEKKKEKEEVLMTKYKMLQNQKHEAQVKLQKAYKIKIEGDRAPMMLDCFKKMKEKYALSDSFMDKIKKAGYIRPTPVQMQAIPIVFEKRDAIVLAETGSGKSLAFIAPLVHLHTRGSGLKAIIVVPTRELAIQLYKEFLMFSNISKKEGADK